MVLLSLETLGERMIIVYTYSLFFFLLNIFDVTLELVYGRFKKSIKYVKIYQLKKLQVFGPRAVP